MSEGVSWQPVWVCVELGRLRMAELQQRRGVTAEERTSWVAVLHNAWGRHKHTHACSCMCVLERKLEMWDSTSAECVHACAHIWSKPAATSNICGPMSSPCQTDSLIRVHGLAVFHAYRTHYNKDCVITDAEWVIFKSCTRSPYWGYFHMGFLLKPCPHFLWLKDDKRLQSLFFPQCGGGRKRRHESDQTDTM